MQDERLTQRKKGASSHIGKLEVLRNAQQLVVHLPLTAVGGHDACGRQRAIGTLHALVDLREGF